MPEARIRTARATLRPLRPDDLDAFHAIWGDPEVIFWGATPDLAASRVLLEELITRKVAGVSPSGWLAIELADGGVVGDVVLQPAPWRSDAPEIGWHVARSHQRQGHATEAASALLDHAFQSGIATVVARILPANEPSRAVAAALGMRVAGTIGLDHGVHEEWVVTAGSGTV